MKQTSKIVILAIAILAVALGIMQYAKTRVLPPEGLDTHNQFKDKMDDDINSISKTKDDLNNRYLRIKDEIELYYQEKFIDNEQKDDANKRFLDAYIPLFISDCYSLFAQSIWPDNKVNDRRMRIDEMFSTQIIEPEYVGQLERISTIIDNYYAACKLASNTNFYSVDDTRNRLNQANDYKKMDYLHNCDYLVTQLDEMYGKLRNSHYRYLDNKLLDFRNTTFTYKSELQNAFNQLYNDIEAARDLYGPTDKLDELKERAGTIYKNKR